MLYVPQQMCKSDQAHVQRDKIRCFEVSRGGYWRACVCSFNMIHSLCSERPGQKELVELLATSNKCIATSNKGIVISTLICF